MLGGSCFGPDGYTLLSDSGASGSIPGNFMWDSWWMKQHCSRIFSKFLWFYPANHQRNICPLICHCLHVVYDSPNQSEHYLLSRFHASSLTQHLVGYRVSKFHQLVICGSCAHHMSNIFCLTHFLRDDSNPQPQEPTWLNLSLLSFILTALDVYINNTFASLVSCKFNASQIFLHILPCCIWFKLTSDFASCMIKIMHYCRNPRCWIQ